MATHSSVLAWRIPGTGEPGGLPSMGLHKVGHNWSDLAAEAWHLRSSKWVHVIILFPRTGVWPWSFRTSEPEVRSSVSLLPNFSSGVSILHPLYLLWEPFIPVLCPSAKKESHLIFLPMALKSVCQSWAPFYLFWFWDLPWLYYKALLLMVTTKEFKRKRNTT